MVTKPPSAPLHAGQDLPQMLVILEKMSAIRAPSGRRYGRDSRATFAADDHHQAGAAV